MARARRRRPGGAGRCQPDPATQRDRRPAGPLGLGQVDPAALHRRPDHAPPPARSSVQRHARRRHRPRRGHGVPELRPVSLADGAEERGAGPGGPGRAGRGAPQARPGRHRPDRPGRVRERLSQGAVRRHAPAGGPGPRPGGAALDPADGRAVLGPGRADRRDPAHRPAGPVVRRAACRSARSCWSPTTSRRRC